VLGALLEYRATARAKRTGHAGTIHHTCLAYAILAGVGLSESKGIWGRFAGWLWTVRTEYPPVWVTGAVIAEEIHRFLPELKRLRVFRNIIASMRTDTFFYKAA
jgi:hypothetical protein